jgi:phosphoribosylaminoimidazolecarboxamide formyltransferase/IMP cyclohydrolase
VAKNIQIKRALVSVYDKTGLLEFARALTDGGVEILSTGGTARELQKNGIAVTPVSQVTGFPEILGGRVKTLHPNIHGAILARDDAEQMAELASHGIIPIDMVAVNLYPFEKTIAKPNVTLDEALENIDIGGPCMIRAAAKNHPRVTVITDPSQYQLVLTEMRTLAGCVSGKTRYQLAQQAFVRTSQYDNEIQAYLQNRKNNF